MMRIAICDDNLEFLEQIESSVLHTYKDMQMEIEILCFRNGQLLLEELKKSDIDLLLLDIDMPELSGLEVAKRLRETEKKCILMFISSYETYVFDTFEYQPFRFIRKGKLEQELPIALRAAEGVYQKNKKRYVILRCDEGELRIEEMEILYFEVVRRQIRICLVDGRVLHIWKAMKELQQELSSDRFSKIHSGCVVNLKYVSGYAGCQITLDNGERLTASRGGIKTFKEELSRYWSR